MSTELGEPALLDESPDDAGMPELSLTGKRIELRRLERRLTKRQLAQRAGISRQQLWRIMTGKAEITAALGARLALALEVDSRWLADGRHDQGALSYFGGAVPVPASEAPAALAPPESWAAFVADRTALERALAALPADLAGGRLKRALLNAVEDVAAATSEPLPLHFFDLRREVVNGER